MFRTNLNLEKVCVSSIWNGIYAYTINEMEFLMQLEGCTTRVIAGASFYHWNSSAIQESNALYDNMTVRELPVELSEEEISDMIKGMDKEQRKIVQNSVETLADCLSCALAVLYRYGGCLCDRCESRYRHSQLYCCKKNKEFLFSMY